MSDLTEDLLKSVFVALAATSCQRSGKRLQNAAALAKASSGTD